MRFFPLKVLACVVAILMICPIASPPLNALDRKSISVQTPNGGEVWIKGTIQTITWTSNGNSGPVKLLLIKGEKVFGEIELNGQASGRYNWVVGDCPASGQSAEPGRDYRIRVQLVSDPSLRDDSNAPFRILPED